MGKKRKGNKLAKMSEEERARYLQQRADMEEETRRRKMQLIALYMKNKLKHEEAFARLNLAKINQKWRTVLRQKKVKELHNEIEKLAKYFKDVIQSKDAVIQCLIDDLNAADDMYCNLQQTHTEIIERILGIYSRRIAFFKQIYEDAKHLILEEWQKDYAELKAMYELSQQQLECVIYQLQDTNAAAIKKQNEGHLQRIVELKSGLQLELEQITQRGECKLEQLWQDYQNVLSGYMQRTESFYAEYVDLKERNDETTAQIREQKNEMELLTEQLANAKLVVADVSELQQTKIHKLQCIIDELTARLNSLRKRMSTEQTNEAKLLKLMSVCSYNANRFAKDTLAIGECLLQTVAICRKLETEREHLLPFGLPPLPREMFATNAAVGEQMPSTALHVQLGIDYFPQLNKFWRRVNNVTVDVASLKQAKKQLTAEHERLKAAVRAHLIQLNICNGSNAHISDYLAKRPNSMRVQHVTQMELEPKKVQSAKTVRLRPLHATINCIEANLSNVVRAQQLDKSKTKLNKIHVRIHR